MKKLFTLLFTILVFSAAMASFDDIVKEDPFLKEFAVYPNPSTGLINISLETFDDTQEMKLKIFNLIGQEMKSQVIPPFSNKLDIRLDLASYPNGIYMIEITNGKQSRTKRVSII